MKIGYVPINSKSSLAFAPPRLLRGSRTQALSDRAVQACPAVNVVERRIIEILAPFSIQIRCISNSRSGYDFHIIENGTRIDREIIPQFVTFMPRKFWRNEKYPVVQIGLPHIFVCDENCYVTQMPAWASDRAANIPGQLISGRFPTHIWPRSLNLSFEWKDFQADFKMKAGEPICYLFVETDNLEANVSLVSAKMTADLRSYLDKMEDVVKFTSGSFGLFDRAAEVRPKTLLSEW
ncbi:hypothetical protein [Parasphingorhabdus flavimaris]|uniref:hypothetical protein n=1 Tax=Parasphingorhabdus flavimaris TaxID=266812 RepID=UPI0030016A28